MVFRRMMLTVVAIGTLATGVPIHAETESGIDGTQTAAPPRDTGPAASDRTELVEIVVTAQRREENLQRVPVAVTVASGETLQELKITQPSELIFIAPSLQQQTTVGEVGATNFSIRGVGSAVFGNGIESSVGTVLDDVTLARPQLGVTQFFDIDNIQILRGPQGMLFGKNASAGLVSINTNRPHIGETSLDFYDSTGFDDSVGAALVENANATVNLPISSNAAARISTFVVRNGSFINYAGTAPNETGLTEYGGRVKLLWEPTDALAVYLAGDFVTANGLGDGVFTSRYNAPGGVYQLIQGQYGIIASPTNLRIADGAASFHHLDTGGEQANVKYTFASGYSLTNILAYRFYRDDGNNDFDQTPYSLADTFYNWRDIKQTSEELRLASSNDGRFVYQIGLYYLNLSYPGSFIQGANLEPLFPPPPPGETLAGSNRYYHLSSQSKAAFGQGEFKIADGLSLLFGGRYTRDGTLVQNTYNEIGYIIPTVTPGVISNDVETNNFSYKAGLNYQITPDIFTYAQYARGYKGPAFDQTTLMEAKPEIPHSVEVGIKSTLLDRRLSVNVAAFHTIFDDFQAQAYYTPPGSNVGEFTTVNAGSLRVQGLEADLRFIAVPGLTFTGGAAFTDGIYTSFVGAPCYPGQPTGTSGRDVCLPNDSSNVSGGRLANAPRFTINLAGEYERTIGRNNAFLGADIYNRSSLNFSATQDPKTEVGGITLVGAHVGYRDPGRRWELTAFARNLFDRRFATFITPNPLGTVVGDAAKGGDYYQTFGPESFRTVGVSFTGHF